MKSNNSLQPLLSDPVRQAYAPNAGFLYQHWTALAAWLTLQEDELLVIEGAEDFDRISANEATVTQVRRTSDEIKLSVRKAAIAVGNFLVTAAKNGHTEIRYVYATTSSAGVEPNSGLRISPKGVIAWSMCSAVESLNEDQRHDVRAFAELLRRPLARRKLTTDEQTRHPSDDSQDPADKSSAVGNAEEVALNYLEDALSDSRMPSFFDQIVKRIVWDTSSADYPEVEEKVKSKLKSTAEDWQARPELLASSRHRLLHRIQQAAAGRNDGRLTTSELNGEIAEFLTEVGFSISTPPANLGAPGP